MLKNILNLGGAQELSKNEQKEIIGGLKHTCSNSLWCTFDRDCLPEVGGGSAGVCLNQCCVYEVILP